MYQIKPLQRGLMATAVTSALIAGDAIAAQAALEEVVVTATRRSTSVQDIPFNISALSSELIARERLSNFAELARRVSGMTVVDQGPRSGNTMAMRGLTVDSIAAPDQSNSTGGTVATYLGEIPFYVDLRLEDLNRVEVLRGPQGTLYGAGTLGGALRYIPEKPDSDALSMQLRGDIFDLSESSDPGYDGGFTVNLPLVDNTLALRASLDYLDDPGFIDYNFLLREPGVSNPQPDFNDPADVRRNLRRKQDANSNETLSGRVALRYTDARLDATLSYYYQDSDIGARQINHADAIGTGDYEAAHRFLEPNERENELFALELVADLGFAELTSATGYGEYDEAGQRDQTDLLLSLEYGYEFFPAFAAFTREDSKEETFTQELRLVSTGEGPLNWIVGAFYRDFQQDSVSREFTPGFDQYLVDIGAGLQLRPDQLEFIQVLEEDFEETAAFGEIGYRITDAWQVTVGARWFRFDNKLSGGADTPLLNTVIYGDPADAINIPLQQHDVDDDDIIFKLNTSYDFSDELMSYFTVSEGYRLGGLNPVAACEDPLPPGQNTCALPGEQLIKSDTTTNYELGLRSTWLEQRLVLNGALYYIDWDDIQVQAFTENGDVPILANGSSARSTGIELSGQYLLSDNLSLTASYAYTSAELTADAPGLIDGADAFDGDRLPGTPEHQGFLGVNYSVYLNAGARLEFDWSMTAQSDVVTKVGERDNGESLDGFALHNVSASWLRDGLSVTLYADNVLDEYAETGLRGDRSDIGQVGLFDSRRYYHNMVRPRQVGLRFTYDFGGQ